MSCEAANFHKGACPPERPIDAASSDKSGIDSSTGSSTCSRAQLGLCGSRKIRSVQRRSGCSSVKARWTRRLSKISSMASAALPSAARIHLQDVETQSANSRAPASRLMRRSCCFGLKLMLAGLALAVLMLLTLVFFQGEDHDIKSIQAAQMAVLHTRKLLASQHGVMSLEVPNQPEHWTSLAHMLGSIKEKYHGAPNASRIAMDPLQHLGQRAQVPITRFCIYGERCSGTNWVTGLLHANFLLEENPAQCPHKHDLKLTVPNEFAGLAEDTLVVSVVRNVLDWTTSLYNKPWHAQNHCNISFPDFLVREWSLGDFAEEPQLMPPCSKYVKGMKPYYEISAEGKHPRDVLELRSWKLRRQLAICDTRRQSICLRYEDVFLHQKDWLRAMQQHFGLQTRPGFPRKVVAYKGWGQLYIPHSELATLVHKPESSQYFDQETMNLLLDRLDTQVETAAGFSYTAALKDFLPAWLAANDGLEKLFG